MWCIGALTEEYRQRMYNLLELYARPLSRVEPVICIDEKSLQLIGNSRAPLPMAPHAPAKQDYEYTRNGTTNLFVAVEPKAGQRIVSVTERRGKVDFVAFGVLGQRAATKLLRRVQFHYTPKHASWLNMAEIEIGILSCPVPGSADCQSATAAIRSRRLAASSKRPSANHRVEIHSAGCRYKAWATLCFETCVLMYQCQQEACISPLKASTPCRRQCR